MQRILFILFPIVFALLAFHPVNDLQVSGRITDAAGNAVPSATVHVKGTKTAALTDKEGRYQINCADEQCTLVFSSVGYKTQEIAIHGKKTINVILQAETSGLEEVVVTAMNTKKEKSVAPADIFNALQGRVAGLSVTNSYGTTRGVDPGRHWSGETREQFNTEGYDLITENSFLRVSDNPLSTFSIDVDAASYSNVRRILNEGRLPPAGAVRIEEMVNYFHYDYPQPAADQPFSINTEISEAPWNKEHKLVLIGLQGKKISADKLPACNLVFLIDVSGSMNMPNKLPLVKASMKMLVEQLRPQDHVAMVVYAGNAGLVLPPTGGSEKTRIKDAIDQLDAGGSTAGGEGIRLAYKTAKEYFAAGGNNRIILCTDGDFNVGASSDDDMETLIEKERKSGIFLTVLGYGMGNYKDSKMQKLADKGNGNHAYIDGISEAKKVLVSEFGGTLFTIAKDVKLQVEFNPAKVQGYRLIGYENRMLAKEDFNDDTKDAGEMGSGHTVTALYEIIPAGVHSSFLRNTDSLKYQANLLPLSTSSAAADEILTVKFRYKEPGGARSRLIEHPVKDVPVAIAGTSDNFRFAASVAEFGMLLRNSAFKSAASYDQVLRMGKTAKGEDEEGYRSEFIRLVVGAQLLARGEERKPADMARADNE